MRLALGLKPHDPARLAAAPAIFDHFDPEQPPERLSRAGVSYQPQMGDNAVDPDCTAESLRECATAQAAALGGYTLNVTRRASLDFFCRCSGLDPATATQEQIRATGGADLLEVAQWQLQRGFDIGNDRLAGLFGRCDPTDRARLASGAARFGLGWWGIRLYQRDMDGFDGAEPWDDDGADPGPLVGGHAIGGGWEYTGLGDRDEVLVATWGRLKPTSWRWVERRLDIALCVWWRQLDPAGGGVDADALEADLWAWAR